MTSPTRETQAEATVIKEVLAVTTETNNGHDELMLKGTYRQPSGTSGGFRALFETAEQNTSRQMKLWEKGTQVRCQGTSGFQEDQQRLNLQKNADGLYECRGRIQGDYPIYLPDDALLSQRLVLHAHLQTLHGGVS